MSRLQIIVVLFFSIQPVFGKDKTQEQTIRFPAVSTILSDSELSKIRSMGHDAAQADGCLLVEGYFGAQQQFWTYRIVGRSRVLEVYRLLLEAGVAPDKVRIQSLGPLNESREYRSKPGGTDVRLLHLASSHAICKSTLRHARTFGHQLGEYSPGLTLIFQSFPDFAGTF